MMMGSTTAAGATTLDLHQLMELVQNPDRYKKHLEDLSEIEAQAAQRVREANLAGEVEKIHAETADLKRRARDALAAAESRARTLVVNAEAEAEHAKTNAEVIVSRLKQQTSELRKAVEAQQTEIAKREEAIRSRERVATQHQRRAEAALREAEGLRGELQRKLEQIRQIAA